MREIKIQMHLKDLKDTERSYFKNNTSYYFEIFFASNRVITRPFKIQCDNEAIPIDEKLKIQNQCGNSLEFWLKTYKDNVFVASGEVFLEEINENGNVIDLKVEKAFFTRLEAQIEVTQEDIQKQVIVERDEDMLIQRDEIDWEEEERKRLEEEKRKKEQEELEALKREQLKKTIVTLTTQDKQQEPYF